MVMSAAEPTPLADGAGLRMPWVVLAAIFLSSYLTWRPSQDVMFTLSDLLFLIGLGRLLYLQSLPLEPFNSLTPVWMAGFGMIIGGLLIGSIGGPAPGRWTTVASQYLFAWVVLPMILLRRGPGETVTMLKAYVWGVFTVNLFGALIYFFYTGSFEDARAVFGVDFLTGGRRLGAFTGDANWNGAVLAMAVPCVVFLWAKAMVSTLRTLIWLTVLLLGIMLTASFTAFISCVAAMIIFAVVSGVPKLRSLFRVSAGMGLVVLVLFERGWLSLPATFRARVGNAIGSGDISEAGTYDARVQLIREAWTMVHHHMLVGLGADQYRVFSALKAPVHNMYLLLWAEGGLIAMFGWIVMLAVPLAAAFRAYSRDRVASALTLSVSTIFIIASTASPHMYARLWAVPMLLALAVSLEVMRQQEPVFRSRKLGKLARVAP